MLKLAVCRYVLMLAPTFVLGKRDHAGHFVEAQILGLFVPEAIPAPTPGQIPIKKRPEVHFDPLAATKMRGPYENVKIYSMSLCTYVVKAGLRM